MSDNIIYEISRMMNDGSIIKSDLNAAAGLVSEMFKKKYINRLNEKASEHKKVLSKDPPKEVQLLNAIKQFMPVESQKNADKAIDAYITASTIEKLRKEFSVTREAPSAEIKAASTQAQADDTPEDISASASFIHEDGVYEIDENCRVNKNQNGMAGMMMVMALLMR